jgi:hypothetical protein
MNRDALIAAMQATAAEKPRAVTIKGWGTLFVRPLTTAEVEEGQTQDAASTDKRSLARGAARLICDESGERLFDPANKADVELLAKQPWQRLRRLLEASDEDVKEAGEPGN